MTKVNCLKGIISKLSGKSVNSIEGDTVCDCLHQLIDCVEQKFVVNVTENEDHSYSSDKTLAEIYAAHQAGKIIECHYSVFALHPLMVTDSVCSFSCEVMSASTIAERTSINITADSVGVTTLRHTLTPAS